MKTNKTKLYARALAEIVLKGASAAQEKKIIDNFLKLLTKTGQEKKAKEILRLAEDFLLAKQGKRKITFETARKMTVGQKKMLESFAKKGDIIKEKINPELIAGIKIIINESQQFDASMQSKLQNIYGRRNN
jgi:F0F1-type ATP synthase delta subunit